MGCSMWSDARRSTLVPHRYTSMVLRIMCRQSGQFCWYMGWLNRMFVQSLHKQRCLHGSSTTVLVQSWQITHFFLSSCSFSRVSRFSAGRGLLSLPEDDCFFSGLSVLDEGRTTSSSSWWAPSPALPSGGSRLSSPGSPSPPPRSLLLLSLLSCVLRASPNWLLSRDSFCQSPLSSR